MPTEPALVRGVVDVSTTGTPRPSRPAGSVRRSSGRASSAPSTSMRSAAAATPRWSRSSARIAERTRRTRRGARRRRARRRTSADCSATRSIDVVHVCTPNRTHVDDRDGGRSRPASTSSSRSPSRCDAASALEGWPTGARQAAMRRSAFTYRGYPMVRRARGNRHRPASSATCGSSMAAYIQDWLAEATDYNWRLEPARRRVASGRRHRLALVRHRRVRLRSARRRRSSPTSPHSCRSGQRRRTSGAAFEDRRGPTRDGRRAARRTRRPSSCASTAVRVARCVDQPGQPGPQERVHPRARGLARDACLGPGGRRAAVGREPRRGEAPDRGADDGPAAGRGPVTAGRPSRGLGRGAARPPPTVLRRDRGGEPPAEGPDDAPYPTLADGARASPSSRPSWSPRAMRDGWPSPAE